MLSDATDVADWPFPRTCPMSPPPQLGAGSDVPPRAVRLPAGAVDSRLAWLVTRHADVKQALADPRLSADETLPGAPVRIQIPPGERASSFLRMDDPEHNKLRSLITSDFTARRSRRLEPDIRQLIDDLLDGLEATEEKPTDLCEAFSSRLPTLVIARLLGVPAEHNHFFVDVTRRTLAQDDFEQSYAAYQEMTAFLTGLAEEKAARPADDLMSRLASKHLASGAITLDELVGIARLVLVAGHETTTNQIALSTLSLLLDDELRTEVFRDDAKLLPQYVEESVRFWSISQDAIVRLVMEDLELGGVSMAAGDAVVISIPAGNHDTAVFPDAGRIDVHRDSSDHMQWGFGAHYCLGAPLARLELELALKELFRRFPTLRLGCDRDSIPFRRNTVFYGLTALPVTW
ncbi:cytochrome P450 (plasmid) [Streptomyces sp. NBC_01387]|uniref:cytochrome P450 n=1 Tax=unclassified Streptomyces TaxID=2593676 RepID=UPI00202546FC|nr:MULTISPECIES: cytochrome P450 [unclassified Streptomyces]MCX4554428.1 cytochrome P450 [Streptomyces sp. NBC_01500]WSC25194.1 cytochrome P450 [Streptomyces sp. NBC_01766]WSV58930.1 cytochrome P450 [Streptomyces sp. NBC_01014]